MDAEYEQLMNAARTERTPERLYSLGTFLFKHHQKIEQTLPFFFSFLDTSYIPVWPLSDYGPCLQELRRANVSILVILQTYQETALREADGGHPILEIFTRCWPVVWKWIDTFIIIVEDEPVCVELWLAELIAKALMNIQMAVRVVCYEKHTILARGPSSVAPLIRLWFALLHSPTFSESVERPYPGEDKNMTQILLHSHIERLTSHCSELIGPLSAPALILKRMVEEDPIRFIEASVAYLRKQLKADIGSDDNDLVLQIHLVAVMILNVHNLAHLEHCWRILPGCEIVNLVVQFLDLMAQEPFEEHKARSISLAIGIAVRMIREITSVSFTSAKRCLRLAFRRRILYQFVRLQPWLAGASTMSVEHIPEQERRDELGTLIEDTIMPHLVHGSVLLAAVQEISLLGDPEQLQQMDMGSATESWRVLILSITQYGAIQCATRVKCAHQGCERDSKTTVLKVCAGCQWAPYCSRACQKRAWATEDHRTQCAITQKQQLKGQHPSLEASVRQAAFMNQILMHVINSYLATLDREELHHSLDASDLPMFRLDFSSGPVQVHQIDEDEEDLANQLHQFSARCGGGRRDNDSQAIISVITKTGIEEYHLIKNFSIRRLVAFKPVVNVEWIHAPARLIRK